MALSLQLGPFALPYALVVILSAVALGWLVGTRLGRRGGVDAEPLLWRLLIAGLIGARLAYVLEWQAAYLAEPLSILDLRDGGWDMAAGVVAACFYGAYAVRQQHALRRPVLAALAVAGTAWGLGMLVLVLSARPVQPLPPLTLIALDGRPVSLSSFTGKPTVLNLWATWCPPCRREMPVLQKAQIANPDVNFVFVNQGETPEAIARFLEQQGLSLRNVLVDARLAAGSALGQRALPTTVFLDAKGGLSSARLGELSHATLAQRLNELRGTSPPVREFSLRP